MRLTHILSAAAALAFAVAPAFAQSHGVSPMFTLGPHADTASVSASSSTGSNYLLFTCQIPGSSFSCYDPYQMRHAYGVDSLIASGYDGRGKTIVIIDGFSDPNLAADFNYFINYYGLTPMNGLGNPTNPALPTFKVIAPQGAGPANANWSGEMSLDVEWAHAIAPGANITLVTAKSSLSSDMLAATKYAIDNQLGDVISQSFGMNESCVDPTVMAQQHELFVEATQKKITLFASAGDYGTTQVNCDGTALVKAASSPAVDPLVTAVGGTELHAAPYCLSVLGCVPAQNPAPGTYQGEVVWNESTLVPGGEATGGGYSVVFDEPPSQEGTIHGGKQRGAPDVAYNAAVYHGVLTYIVGAWNLVGGTSAGSPQWAAITAIADQRAGHNLGYINSALYRIGQSSMSHTSFNDVVSGNNSWAGITGYSAAPGWDAVTGFGSPEGDNMVSNLLSLVSAGDGTAAIAASKPHTNAKPNANGHVQSH
ncbi:MAG TPA: S53 family peptidase [Candidatus Koribacter sp.]|jgi:subtilase family serine protease